MAIRVKNTLEKGGILDALLSAFNTLVTNCNASIGSVTGVNLLVADHNKAAVDLATVKTDHDKAAANIISLRATLAAVQADVAALRTTLAATQADVAAAKTAHDTLATKLNADEGVTDTNYAAMAALTSSAPAALTSSAPAATTVVGTITITAEGSVADVEAGGITASETLTVVDH